MARRYAEGVVSGKIPACQWVAKACRRQLDDLARAKDKRWVYEFKAAPANRICQFVELMPHVKGEWAKRGERIRLEPWQAFIFTTVFGWIRCDTGLRRFRTVLIEVPRKNSKSTMSAPVGVYMMCADGEAGSEVYSAATTRDQAKIVWEVAKMMVERESGLRRNFNVDTSAHSIFQTESASSFRALSAEGNSLDGLNIHCGIIDELHAHQTRKVFDVLETAKAARLQPLLWNITTAGGNRAGICYEQRTYLTKVLDRAIEDETYFGIIYSIDEGDDWTSEAAWKKANPNYGVSVSPSELAALCRKAKSMPSAQNNFMTKHLSVWVNADAGLFNMAALARCVDKSLDDEQFIGETCHIGIDLAPQHDFSDKVKLFERDGHYFAFADHFLSDGEIENSENAQLSGWARDGWITTNPGNVTDYRLIRESLERDMLRFNVAEVPFDPNKASEFAVSAQEIGAPLVQIAQNVKSFSEPTDKLSALIADGKFHYNGDPVLTWMFSNVVGRRNRKGEIYPTKDEHQPQNKIDGVVALIMALNRAIVAAPAQTTSCYDRGERAMVI